MLRDSQPIDVFSRKPRSLAITAVGLAIACLTIAGVREPQAQATPPQQPAQAEGKPRGTIDLSAVPSGTGMMIAFRPGDILGKPGFETLETYIGPEGEITKQLGIQPVQVEQVTIVWLSGASDPRRSPSNPEPTVVIVRAAKAHDWTSWANADFVRGNAEQAQFAGETYTRSAGISDGAALLRPDVRTLIVASRESSLKLYLTARKVENPGRPWDAAWKAAGEGQAGIAIDSAFLAQMLAPMTEPGGRGPNLDAFSPLWTKAYAHAVKFNVGNTISLETASSCGTEDGAQQVARTMEAMVTIGTNMLTEMAQPAPGVPKPFLELVSVANEALGSAKVQRDGKLVNLRASSSSQIVAMVKNVLVPAVVSARSAARRAMSVNNLRQIGLAMFNYASAHDERFPPAVVMGPDGKTPHSWRVELLPYLDQNDLYLQYKMNEPWDSPANLKVLEQRPAIFAFSEGVPPTETSYFAVVGPETLFPNDGDGTAFRDITDGLSNTFLVVEAKRSIPWTKPEDIPLDKGQAVPDFGTYYPESPGTNMLLADGSVKFISKTIDAKMLRALFTRAGGEVVSFPR